MKIDPVPVWTFFDIPENAIELCQRFAQKKDEQLIDRDYWQRAARFLQAVKSNTVDQLAERDFDWLLKLRVQFERDEDSSDLQRKIKSINEQTPPTGREKRLRN